MSDAVLVTLITTLGLIITGYLNYLQNRKIQKKVDTYHEEVNGHMTELLDTTKELGKKIGKEEEKAKQELKDNKK